MAGFITLNAIKRFPESFAALILFHAQSIADTPEVKENYRKAIEQIILNGTAEFNEKFIRNVFHPNSLTNKKELVESLRSIVFANFKEMITVGLIALVECFETCSSLDSIRIPALIICSREDVVIPLRNLNLCKHEKRSILKIIDNARYFSNLKQPDEFNKSVNNFLNSFDPNNN